MLKSVHVMNRYILYLKDSWAFKHSDLFKGACSNHSRSVSSVGVTSSNLLLVIPLSVRGADAQTCGKRKAIFLRLAAGKNITKRILLLGYQVTWGGLFLVGV